MKVCQSCLQAFATSDWRCPACGYVPIMIDNLAAFAPELALQHVGFPGTGFHDLAALEADSFWFRSRNKLIVWALRKYFPRARNLLEIGCGTGFVLSGIEREFPDLALSGSELQTAGLIHAARRLKRAELFQMDARNIPFFEEFDLVGCFDMLEHTVEDTVVLGQAFKALRRGGGVLLTVPQHPFLWGPDDEYAQHVRRYTSAELVEKLVATGFRLLRSTSFVSLLLPLMMVSRYRKKHSEAGYDPTMEFRIGRALNWSLERVLDFERTLVAAGVNFPFGGSLLAIAQKP
jgi:SAM-dependent methyltransferase